MRYHHRVVRDEATALGLRNGTITHLYDCCWMASHTNRRFAMLMSEADPSPHPDAWAYGVYPARERGWISWFRRETPSPEACEETRRFTLRFYAEGFDYDGIDVGTRIAIRESFALVPTTADFCAHGGEQIANPTDPAQSAIYRAGWERASRPPWRSPTQMPRWAVRTWLVCLGIAPIRAHDLTEADAQAAGAASCAAFAQSWDAAHQRERAICAWAANPWLWQIRVRTETSVSVC